jgi:hypothetical protein
MVRVRVKVKVMVMVKVKVRKVTNDDTRRRAARDTRWKK